MLSHRSAEPGFSYLKCCWRLSRWRRFSPLWARRRGTGTETRGELGLTSSLARVREWRYWLVTRWHHNASPQQKGSAKSPTRTWRSNWGHYQPAPNCRLGLQRRRPLRERGLLLNTLVATELFCKTIQKIQINDLTVFKIIIANVGEYQTSQWYSSRALIGVSSTNHLLAFMIDTRKNSISFHGYLWFQYDTPFSFHVYIVTEVVILD